MIVMSNMFDKIGIAHYSQEISTLTLGGRCPMFHRIYSDSCDEGFTMVSARTNNEIDFYVKEIDYQGEGSDREIAGWQCIPTPESIRKHPEARYMRVLIVND